MTPETAAQAGKPSSADALGRVLAASIEEIAREVAREEGRRAALEALDRSSAAPCTPEWVTQTKAAALADCTPQTIREWARAGYLGEQGRRGRINVARLHEYLATTEPSRAARVGRARKIAQAVLLAHR